MIPSRPKKMRVDGRWGLLVLFLGLLLAVPGIPLLAAPPQGDPIVGKDLFTGVTPFQNGGPPCMACHSVAGIGALGGGALGPDLTASYNKFGEQGTTSILAALPFPTMNPIYSKRPLTPDEQNHLKTFLQNADISQRSPQAVGQLVLLAAAGVVIFLGLAHLLWRNRLPGVRRPMVKGER